MTNTEHTAPNAVRPGKMSRSAPSMSGGWLSTEPRISPSARRPKKIAASPIGTLTRKTQCQLNCVSNPPIGAPSVAAAPPTATNSAIAMERFSGGWFDNLLVPQWLAAMPDVQRKLSQGADVADVGCGRGRALIRLAQSFPISRYVGYDAFAPSIERATTCAREASRPTSGCRTRRPSVR